MLKILAIIFGIIMLIVGILGFYPEFTPNGMLMGIFHVNEIHNIIHITTGVFAILCGLSGQYASKVFFRIFGIVYGLVAILGFFYLDQPIFGLVANNLADAFLHAGIAIFSLWLGFCSCCHASCEIKK
jgi:hypothetical protein